MIASVVGETKPGRKDAAGQALQRAGDDHEPPAGRPRCADGEAAARNHRSSRPMQCIRAFGLPLVG